MAFVYVFFPRPPKEFAGSGTKLYPSPLCRHYFQTTRLKTGGSGPLMHHTRSYIVWALLNFRLMESNLGVRLMESNLGEGTEVCKIKQGLSDDLENVYLWFKDNMLHLHNDKTKSVLFGTVKRLSMNDELRIDLQGKPIKNVTSYKYLGVYLDRGLTFIEHINRLKMKIAKWLGALTRSRPFLTSYAAIKVYTAMVLPVFDYCDVVWDTLSDSQQHKLEKLQSRAEKNHKHVSVLRTKHSLAFASSS